MAAGVACPAASQERISGRAKITDGDSFEIGATSIRLFGVDAPEGRQPCTRDGREWACGEEAARRLRSLTGSGNVVCTRRDVDDYGRVVAQCSRGGVDLAAEMARSGLAVAYRRYSNAYVDEENEARVARRGLWAGEFTPPEQWRRSDGTTRNEPMASPPAQGSRAGCDIKGNINGDGEKIFHTRASPSYADTRIDETAGERWFCSEAEARREGWRAPR
jgi:endonuclease YncB( thermonuclease family)